MKNITETQLAIQRKLEQQLRSIYDVDAKLQAIAAGKSEKIEALEQQLREEVRERSLRLTRHLARNEHNTKELIRLELEHEQLQQSNISQQQQLSTLQNTVSTARRHQQFLMEQTNALQEKSDNLQAQHDLLTNKKNELQETLLARQKQCDTLQEEVDALQRKAKHLQQNIDGLLQMRENDMLSVMDLTARLSDVSSGKE